MSSEYSSPGSVASQTPAVSSSVVIHEGNETKTDGTYSGKALLAASLTSMEAVDVRQTVGFQQQQTDLSAETCACARQPPSRHTCFPNVGINYFHNMKRSAWQSCIPIGFNANNNRAREPVKRLCSHFIGFPANIFLIFLRIFLVVANDQLSAYKSIDR